MAVTGFFHHIGTFLLLVSTILLIITTISAPVVNDIAMLKVTLGNATSDHHSLISFGTFGYCYLNTADDNKDYCSHHTIGYRPADIMTNTEGTSFSTASRDATHVLTKVMILHPIATFLAFVAFLLALGAGLCGSLLAALTSLLAFVVTAVSLICDFVLFGIVRDKVNGDGSGSRARYSVGIWTVLVAGVCLLLGAVVVFFSCCSARIRRRRERGGAVGSKGDYGYPASGGRRWF